MRSVMVGVLAGVLALSPVASSVARADTTQAQEVEYSAVSALASFFYFPFKLVFAAGGLFVGALAGTLNGGDERAAYAFWVPAAGGDFFVTSDRLASRRDVQVIGRDYSDEASVIRDSDSSYDSYYADDMNDD
jgi:hypothetical protein